jgi:large subunit ribosomal protein L13
MPTGRCPSFMARKETVRPEWYHVDASEHVLGRLATDIATVLMGKHKPTYTPHVDTGDFVVVTNCEKIQMTGNKRQSMHYDRYTYYTGGWRTESADKLFERHPDRILRFAVKRMLPKNALGRKMLNKLKIYSGEQHPHQAQLPRKWDF